MGPSAILVAGLVPTIERLGHRLVGVRTVSLPSVESLQVGNAAYRFLPVIAKVCREIADIVEHDLDRGIFPLTLGGDHSLAIGSISGMARHFRKRDKSLGVVWVDAHADMNTPATTTSGNIHGMPLAVLLGHGPRELVSIAGDRPALDPKHVSVIGVRDIDPGEAAFVKREGVRVYTMSELDARGTPACTWEAFERASEGAGRVHFSFDIDSVDPDYAPGVGTPVPGGLSLRESHLICECAAAIGTTVGMDVVELNPTCDHQNRTGRMAVGLVGSVLGKQILSTVGSGHGYRSRSKTQPPPTA